MSAFRIPAASVGLRRLQAIELMLGEKPTVACLPWGHGASPTWLGWGAKRSAARATWYARLGRGTVMRLEDGFLRSVGLGKLDPPLSLVRDSIGIYYDAFSPSELESLVCRRLAPAQALRACDLVTAWRAARVSKYNHSRDYSGELPARYVLVADQTLGDASIHRGLAEKSSFSRMLDAALFENPDCKVVLKVHPEVMAGRKRGYFDLAQLRRNTRIRVIGQDVHPASLIERAEMVYAVTSQMGFEGLLWGKPVRTFGMPFYAGWGLTRDELPGPERRGRATLEQLVHAALVDYPRYVDPETGKRCEVERLIEWMALQRRMRERFPPVVHALGFSRWKKSIVRDFLQGSEVRFVRSADEVPAGGKLAVWGRKQVAGADCADLQVLQLEDGFLRSVGLGADLVRPLSWVLDGRGIYYDATGTSDLEHLLQTLAFEAVDIARARVLRERIVASGLTKYNVGMATWCRPEGAKRVILVPGQVESDASIAFGAPGIRRNIELLRSVRAANPDAYVIYKPHPDVLAGLRVRGRGEDEALDSCDELLTDAAMGQLLGQVDEVHVLTSLAGFEALLRGTRVVTWGQPFYAGWGLTEDHVAVARRTRRLSLDELVAGVLILYPTYLSRTTGRFTTPERALDELLAWRERGPGELPLWRKALRSALRLMKR